MVPVSEIAGWIGATVEGDGNAAITSAAPLETATPENVSFIGTRKALRAAAASNAGCLVVAPDFDNAAQRTVIRAKDPRKAFARIVLKLHPPRRATPGVHPTAVIGAGVTLGADVSVGPYAVIGAGAAIGDRAVIGAHCTTGDGVTIGADSLLHAHVSVYSGVEIGERAVIHSGAVLGADGFGMVFEGDHYEKFPQVGKVVLGNDVEIGANTTVDRAALGVTLIEDGVKLDNHVHIGHNCRVGRHVVIAAQTGMAGGTVVEEYAVLGGQVGIGDNVTIQSRAVIGSGSGILSSKIVKGGGEVYWGTPARPLREYLEGLANINRISDLRRALKELQSRLDALEQGNAKD